MNSFKHSLKEFVNNFLDSFFSVKIVNSNKCNLLLQAPELLEILDKHGYYRSLEEGVPVDNKKNPIPWFTYPSIEYLIQLDTSSKKVFEWGSGNSSYFFAERCQSIISIESDTKWYQYINHNIRDNQKIYLRSKDDFANSIKEFNTEFDIIVIDSIRRYDCALIAPEYLKNGGIIIVDNSDNCKETCKLLREKFNYIQVDFSGFGAICKYQWTTSIFFSRDTKILPKDGTQPQDSISNLKRDLDFSWDE